MAQVEALAHAPCTLGEGALWHAQRRELFWFDILACTMHACDAKGANMRSMSFPKMVSAAAIVDHERLLLATEDGLDILDVATGQTHAYVPLEADQPETRSNDGRCDPWGRFWLGTMGKQAEDHAGALYMIARGSVTCVLDKVSIPNSITFSPDRTRAYFADSKEQVISMFALDPETGAVGEMTSFASLKDTDISPDGSVVDAEGFLWNAQWDGARVVRYDPSGKIDRIVPLPARRPTCPAFGGPDLKTLFVTSATEGMNETSLDQDGLTLRVQQDVSGQPEWTYLL